MADKVNGSAHKPVNGKANGSQLNGDRILSRKASDIIPTPIDWLWPNYIARGKITMIAGNPGLGKSQSTYSIAATVSTGGFWPDGARAKRSNVVILSAEDDPADTIIPRLLAAGADLSRCHIVEATSSGYNADGEPMSKGVNLSVDMAKLERLWDELGDVACTIIDPVTAYMGETDSHNNSDVRALYSKVSTAAARSKTAAIMVTHFNKASGTGDAMMRVMGSVGFVAAARAAFMVIKDHDDETRRLFLMMKNNLGKDCGGFSFHVEGCQIESHGMTIDTSKVIWSSEPVTISANEAMSNSVDPSQQSQMMDARQFLIDLLADGPKPAHEMEKDIRGAGHSITTINRAKKAIGAVSYKDGKVWYWKIEKPSYGAYKKERTRYGD